MAVMFPSVELPPWPSGGDRADLLPAIEAWIRSEALAELIAAFDGAPLSGTIPEVLDQFEVFSDVWNYRRGGLERADIRSLDYDVDVVEVIDAATAALGLADRQTPSRDHYDHVLILGGGTRTALARPAFTADLLSGTATADHVSALSSLRKLGDVEKAFADRVDMVDVEVEADAMAVGLIRAFGLGGPGERIHGRTDAGAKWWTRVFTASALTADVVAAPSGDPARRANTGDTLTGWADYISQPKSSDCLLVVTTDLFVPFQHCDAVRLLGLRFGCGVDTVGLNPLDFKAWLLPNTRSGVLQEVVAAFWSMAALYEDCVAGT